MKCRRATVGNTAPAMTPPLLTALTTLLLIPLAPTCAAQSRESDPLDLLRGIPLDSVEGRIDHLALDTARKRLFVAALENGTVEVVDLASGKRTQQIKGLKEPQGVCVLPSGLLVVASGDDGKVRVFDDTRERGWIDGLADADNVRFDTTSKRVYVGYKSGALAVIDPEKPSKVADIALAAHPESFQLEITGKRIFVNIPKTGHVAVVDREKAKVVATWPLGDMRDNFPMALDEPNHRLFVACRKPAMLLVLDTESGRTIASLECSGDADDVFYDAARGRIYVSGGAGAISVFERKDADHYGLLKTVATSAGARTCLFVPEAGRLYLAVPHRSGQRAEIREFQVRP